MNSLNLRQIDGGNVIKQADFGSNLSFELLDERRRKIPGLDGQTATIRLIKGDNIAYQTESQVVDGSVSFKFDRVLEKGIYVLEIVAGNYVFPSNNMLKITIEKTAGNYKPENMIKTDLVELQGKITAIEQREHDINQELLDVGQKQAEMTKRIEFLEQKEDHDTIYNDTELKERLSNIENKESQYVSKFSGLELKDSDLESRVSKLEQKEDKDTVYDDSAIVKRVEALEQKPDNDTVYNDTEIKEEVKNAKSKLDELSKKVTSLESRTDNDTVYDDTGVKQSISSVDTKVDKLSAKVTELEQRPSSEAYDDTELSNRVTALERKQDNDTIYDDAQLKEEISGTKSKVDSLYEKVSSLESKQDKDTIYDDSEIKRRLTALEQKEDHDTIYDDTEIKQSIANVDNKVSGLSEKVTALEERPIVDTALTKRVEALERKEDRDTVYDDSAIVKRIETLEAREDKDTIYNDTEIKNRLVALEQKEDKDTIYDDSDLKHRVTELENRPVAEPYNDTEIKDRLTVLESKQDKDTVYDDTAIKERISALEEKPDNDTIYDDTNLKAQVVELQEKLKALNVRRAPTGYTLDRTSVPWRILFDNGCILEFPKSSPINERDKANLIYGYGFPANSNSPTAFSAPIPPLIISTSIGTFTVDKFKESDEAHFHVTYADYRLHYPIRNYDDFNWENAYGDRVNRTVSSNGKSNFTKMMYELGIWSEADVLYLGATKK